MKPKKNQAKKTPKNTSDITAKKPARGEQISPVDALSRTPEDLDAEAKDLGRNNLQSHSKASAAKKPSRFKAFLRRINVYFLLFSVLLVIAAIIAIVNYLNSQSEPPAPDIATQSLSAEELQQLANADTSVGDTSQTLTIQGNAVIAGQTLTRGNLDVAGNFQTGGSIQSPDITVSGSANLGETQSNNLQVAGNTSIQGNTTMRDLNVAGSSSFGGAMTASQITVTRLILSGNASLQVPNHISFTGASPSRTANTGTLGAGGSASVNGSDAAGTVNINTGNRPSPGCMVQITFNQPYGSQPHVIISPVGAAAGQTQHYVTRTTSGFSICSANAAPANQSFAFDYFVMN